jgi:hypothetical protein
MKIKKELLWQDPQACSIPRKMSQTLPVPRGMFWRETAFIKENT